MTSSTLSARLVTSPPSLPTILYDGHCRFCTQQMKKLARFLPTGAYRAESFQDAGVLDRFPGLTHDMAMEEMKLIDARGRVFGGAEAAVRAVAMRAIGRLAFLYYVPGLRQLIDWIYRTIARNRYRIAGKTCDDGTCALHFKG
jgi:predicted DCC family thiol-disulfide oxidoreductase YuxK